MLKVLHIWVVVFLVSRYCAAMESYDGQDISSDQAQMSQSGTLRQKVVTFAVPIDDYPDGLRIDDDGVENDTQQRSMNRWVRYPKKGHPFVELLPSSNETSYWQRLMSCLCRLAHAELDENNIYPSLRD